MSVRSTVRKLAALAAVLGLGLPLAGCTSDPRPAPQKSPSAAQQLQDLDSYYDQQLHWQSCGSVVECATVKVPLDYADPAGQSIELALNRRAAKHAEGSLLVNPGGPGGSGLDLVQNSAQLLFSQQLQQHYNIVGFDPRGVGKSTPIACSSDEQTEQSRQQNLRAWVPEEQDKVAAQIEEYAQDCAKNTGKLLGHVDTVSAARDMDIIRAVLGEDKLDYLGYSYGTFLGATYANLFPENTGRLVLDGALDPQISSAELIKGQAQGFEGEIDAWLESCLASGSCPFTGDVKDAKTQLQQFFATIEAEPMTASDGRKVPIIDFVNGFIQPLYDNGLWNMLTTAMAQAVNEDNPDTILSIADLVAGRNPDGSYDSNSTDALTAVNCLDRPVDASAKAMAHEAEELLRISPTLGKYLAYGEMACDAWAYKATGHPEPLKAAGSAPILVVGTTGDPATPYAWSKSLASQLENGSLLTYKGHGHTAYGRSNQCITDAVDGYLVDGKMPADGTTC